MRDIYHNISVTQIAKPAVVTVATTSSALDLQGFGGASVVFAVGASGDTLSGSVYWTLKLRESDDDSTYSDVAGSDLLNVAATVVIDSASEDETSHVFGYKGSKRYLKAVATPTGTHTNGTPIAMLGLLGNASVMPIV